MNRRFAVHLEKEQLIFSAAHFITFGDNVCERLHGHNYRVACEVVGPLNVQGYVIDFIALRDELARLVGQLDHHVLLPTLHPAIQVQSVNNEVVATFEDRRWVFPDEDCCLLPVDNTTAEKLAEHLGNQLWPLVQSQVPLVEQMIVSVDENEGQWGRCIFASE